MIAQHWDDFLRVAGSLKMGTVRASELIRSLQRGGRVSTLERAIGELGWIPKTLHLLNFIADPNYRRHILNQLNRGEGRRGKLRQRYREGQEDQLGLRPGCQRPDPMNDSLYGCGSEPPA